MLLTVGERHTAVQEIDGELDTILSIRRQGHIDSKQSTAVVQQQVVLVTIDDDTVVMIVVHATMTAGTTPLGTTILGHYLVVGSTVLG